MVPDLGCRDGRAAVSSILAWALYRDAQLARNIEAKARVQAERDRDTAKAAQAAETNARIEAKRQADVARLNLYVAQMNLIQQAWEIGDGGRVRELLNAQRPMPGQDDLRSFDVYPPPVRRATGPDITVIDCVPFNRVAAVMRRREQHGVLGRAVADRHEVTVQLSKTGQTPRITFSVATGVSCEGYSGFARAGRRRGRGRVEV